MSSGPLHPDVQLGVHLSAICSRNEYTTNPEPVIDELLATAGDRADILAQEAGTWAGFQEGDVSCRPLVQALRQLPGVGPWIKIGRERRSAPPHGTRDYLR